MIPAVTTLISLVFAAQVLSQYRSRGRTYHLAWGLALLFYAIAAFPEVLGSFNGWSDFEFRIYYLFGAILLVPWLSLGTAELVLGRSDSTRAVNLYRAFVAAITLLGLITVAVAPLHAAFLGTTHVPSNCAMWCKSESGYVLANGLAALSAAVGNSLGTIVLVVGAGLSAYRTYRAGLPRNLTLGNVLILVGSLVVASAATLTRFGSYELFYSGQAAGIAIIFVGFRLIGSVSQPRTSLA
ncbi:MAG: hypothetical protein QOK05_773 [Chloroflexota bacterium]|nr:hypothetical protein [Chloroflexota bacterium]